jgi:hypothetical protein
MNIDDIARIFVIISILGGVIGIAAIAQSLISGSYKRYVDKRKEHLDQLRRVQEFLQRNERH